MPEAVETFQRLLLFGRREGSLPGKEGYGSLGKAKLHRFPESCGSWPAHSLAAAAVINTLTSVVTNSRHISPPTSGICASLGGGRHAHLWDHRLQLAHPTYDTHEGGSCGLQACGIRRSPCQWSLAPLAGLNFSLESLSCVVWDPPDYLHGSQPQSSLWCQTSKARASAFRPHRGSGCADLLFPGKCWWAAISVVNSLCFAFWAPVATVLFWGSEVLPQPVPTPPPTPPMREFPSAPKLFFLHFSLSRVQGLICFLSLSLSLCFSCCCFPTILCGD